MKRIKIKPMNFRALLYSIKIWLTSVVISSLALSAFILFEPGANSSGLLTDLAACAALGLRIAIFELLFSFFTWVAFALVILILIRFSIQPLTLKWIIFGCGVILSAGSCVAIFLQLGMFDGTFLAPVIIISNTVCIGTFTWIYKLRV